MKNIIIIGSDTTLGHIVYLYFKHSTKYKVEDYYLAKNIFKTGKKLNLFSPISIKKMVNSRKNTIFINTLSVLIEESKNKIEKAVYINSFFPNYISSLLRDTNNKFIHISTDCVFSGNTCNYNENSMPDATDNYGKTKALGEVSKNEDLTLRTSKIGPCPKDQSEELLDWFLKQKGEIKGYKNAFWNGVTTLELAKSINKAIDFNLSGIYNLAPFEKISKYELLSIMNTFFGKNLKIIPDYKVNIDRSLIDSRKDIKCEHNNYLEMFYELKNFMNIYSGLYKHYNL